MESSDRENGLLDMPQDPELWLRKVAPGDSTMTQFSFPGSWQIQHQQEPLTVMENLETVQLKEGSVRASPTWTTFHQLHLGQDSLGQTRK